MNKRGKEKIIQELLKRIGEALVKTSEPEEVKTPKEEFIELIAPKESTKEEKYGVKEYAKDKDILLSLEAIQKDREQIAKQKDGLKQEEAKIADQHYSLKKAQLELNGRPEPKNRPEL